MPKILIYDTLYMDGVILTYSVVSIWHKALHFTDLL